VAAHLGKGAIEVQVGQVEESVRHLVSNVSSRLTLPGASAQVNRSSPCHLEPTATRVVTLLMGSVSREGRW